MKRRVWFPVLLLMVTCLLIGAALGLLVAEAPYADGRPPPIPPAAERYVTEHGADICESLDKHATSFEGLVGVLLETQNRSGMSDHDTGVAVTVAAQRICPHHVPLINEFVAELVGRSI